MTDERSDFDRLVGEEIGKAYNRLRDTLD